MSTRAYIRCDGIIRDQRPEWCGDCGMAPFPPGACAKGACRAGKPVLRECYETTPVGSLVSWRRLCVAAKREGWQRVQAGRNRTDLCPACAARKRASRMSKKAKRAEATVDARTASASDTPGA